MKRFNLFLFLILVNYVSAQNINQFDDNGKRHGTWKKNFDKTKVIRYQGEFNHGKEVGTFKFYKNIKNKAILSATRTYKYDDRTAYVQFLDPKGFIISEGKMDSKTYIGEWIYYFEASKKILTKEFYNNNGLLEKDRIVYYKNGKIAEVASYKNGLLNGNSQWFQKEGKKIREITYKDNILQGSFKSYNIDGQITVEGQYKSDAKHGVWKYYENGKLIREKDFTKKSKNPYKQ